MQNAVTDILEQWGYNIEEKEMQLEELFAFKEVLIANALMGAVPVLSIDGKKVGVPSDLWELINAAVWK